MCWQFFYKTQNYEKRTIKSIKKIHADEFSKKLKITKNVQTSLSKNVQFRKMC